MAFSVKEAILFGWTTLRSNVFLLIGIVLAAWIIPSIPNYISDLANLVGLTATILSIIGLILGAIIEIGLIKITLKFVDGQKPKLSEVLAYYKNYRLIFNYIIAAFLFMIVVGIGLVLLIIPGIYLALKYQFFPYFIVEKNAGPLEAASNSGKITEGVKMRLLLFAIVLILLNFVGALIVLVGLLITVPITIIAHAYVFRKLSSK